MTTTAEAATTENAQPAAGRPATGAATQLAELFEEHAALVLGLCRGLLRNAHEAEDAAQQTFLSAYRSLLAGNVPREPVAWLATIARNECAARARQRMREPLPAFADRAEAATNVFVESVRASDVESLRRALAQLPSQQRRAFLLREFSGLSYGELAVALGVSEPAVESLLFRARQQLRLSLRNALAPVNGLLWLPLRLRDLIASAPDAPAAAKVASATAGVALVTTGVVAVVPGHQRQPPHAKPTVRAPAPRLSETRERRVSTRSPSNSLLLAQAPAPPVTRDDSPADRRETHSDRGPEPGEKEVRKPQAEKPEEQAARAPQPVEREHSGGRQSTGTADSGGSRDGGSSIEESSGSSSDGGSGSGSDSTSGSASGD